MRLWSRGQEKSGNSYIYIHHVYSIHHPIIYKRKISRVKVREILDHLSHNLHKHLIINGLSVDKKVAKKGFSS